MGTSIRNGEVTRPPFEFALIMFAIVLDILVCVVENRVYYRDTNV